MGMLETVTIASRCPHCNDSRVLKFPKAELTEMLGADREIDCWCSSCDRMWPLGASERAEVQRDLENPTA